MQDSEQVVVAAAGHVYVANLADVPTLPDPDDAPTDTWSDGLDLGYTSEAGVSFSVGTDVNDINAWQSDTPIRKIVNARNVMISTELLQINQETLAVALGGGSWSQPATGVFRYDPPANTDALAEFAVVVDFADGDRNFRIVMKRATVTDTVETTLSRTGASVLPVVWNALTPDDEDRSWYFVGDDEAALAFAS